MLVVGIQIGNTTNLASFAFSNKSEGLVQSMDECRSGKINEWIEEHLILQGNITGGHIPNPINQQSWTMPMVNTGKKILQYDEARLPLLIQILQEIIEKIINQELRCKILKCWLSAKTKVALKGLDCVLNIDHLTSVEVQCQLDELFQCDKRFLSKLTSLEQFAVKEMISNTKKLISEDQKKARQVYSEEGARQACIAEFDDMAKDVKGEINKSFLALLAEKLSRNRDVDSHTELASTATISSPTSSTISTEGTMEVGLYNSQDVGLAGGDNLLDRKLSSKNSSLLLRNGSSIPADALTIRKFPESQSCENRRGKDNFCIRRTEKFQRIKKRIELLHELSDKGGKELGHSINRRVLRNTRAIADRSKEFKGNRRRNNSSGVAHSNFNSIENQRARASKSPISKQIECKFENCTIGGRKFSGKWKSAHEIADGGCLEDKISSPYEVNFRQSTFRASTAFDQDQCPVVVEREKTRTPVDVEAVKEGTEQYNWDKARCSISEQSHACLQHLNSLVITTDTERDECTRITRMLNEGRNEYNGSNHTAWSGVPTSSNGGRQCKEDVGNYLSYQNERSNECIDLFEEDADKLSFYSCESMGSNKEDRSVYNCQRNDEEMSAICALDDSTTDISSCSSIIDSNERSIIVDSDDEFFTNDVRPKSTATSYPIISSTPKTPERFRAQQGRDMDNSHYRALGSTARSLLLSIEKAKRGTVIEGMGSGDVCAEVDCSCTRHESQFHVGCQQEEDAQMLSDINLKLRRLDSLITDIERMNSCSVISGAGFFKRLQLGSLDREECSSMQRLDNTLNYNSLNIEAENCGCVGELKMEIDYTNVEEANGPNKPDNVSRRKKSPNDMQNEFFDFEVTNKSGKQFRGTSDDAATNDASKTIAVSDVLKSAEIGFQNPENVVDSSHIKRERANWKETMITVKQEITTNETNKKVVDFIDLTVFDSSDDNGNESDTSEQSSSTMDISAFNESPREKKVDAPKSGHSVFDFGNDTSPEKEYRYDKFSNDKTDIFPARMNFSCTRSFSLQLENTP